MSVLFVMKSDTLWKNVSHQNLCQDVKCSSEIYCSAVSKLNSVINLDVAGCVSEVCSRGFVGYSVVQSGKNKEKPKGGRDQVEQQLPEHRCLSSVCVNCRLETTSNPGISHEKQVSDLQPWAGRRMFQPVTSPPPLLYSHNNEHC